MSTAKFSRVFFYFEGTSKSSYHICSITLQKGCRTAFYVSTSLLLEKLFFFGKKFFFENLLTFLEKKFSSVFKTAFNVSSWSLREKLFRNLLLSFIIFYSWAKKFELSMKTFPQSVEIVSYVYTATMWRKICVSSKSNYYVFRGFSQKFFERFGRISFYLFTAILWAIDNFLIKIFYL